MNAHLPPDQATDLRGRFEDVAPVILVDPEPVIRRGRRRRAIARTGAGLGAIAVVLAVVLLIRPDGGPVTPAVSTPPPPEPTRPVAIQVVPQVVAPGDVVTAVLVASEANDLTFGIPVEVDRWDGSAWRRAGVAALCLAEWTCVGTVTDELGGVEDIGLGAVHGTPGPATLLSTEGLADGWYRLVQRAALDKDVATGVFEVRTGARAAPPLPAQDDVRLTIDPALVPPAGGLTRVVTQVPAGDDGTLTAEDLEKVDASLDPSALVQRWDGQGWLDVADVPVEERQSDLGVEWGSPVALPALEEGSYRLVRARTGGSALWGVFTVAAGAPALEQPGAGLDATPDAEPDLDIEDVYAPDHPYCGEQPGQCLLEAWWRDVVAEAGIERGGGDHSVGILLTDSVRVDDRRSLMLTLFPTEAAPQNTTLLTVESTAYVGDVEVAGGRWDDGAYGRRLTCGGFVLQTWSTRVEPGEIDHIVGRLADSLTDCPTDLAALAARYPEFPPVP
jgi:hypothetical protein